MKPNLLKPTNANTVVLERQESQTQRTQTKQVEQAQSQEKNIETFVEEPKHEQTKETHKKNRRSLFNAFNANAFANQEKQMDIKSNFDNFTEVESQTVNQTESSYKDDFEDSDEALISFSSKAKPRKKQWNFRFKLVAAVYVVVLGVMGGWVTANAVRLSNIQNSIHLSDIKYAQKIKDLEQLKERQDENENSNLIPWQEIISIQPLPLEDVTEYERQSNWFDNIVNWFGNLFGG